MRKLPPSSPPTISITPWPIENNPPDTKMNTAARNDQKNRSLPYPKGWPSSGGRSPSLMESSRNPWSVVSATECAASASSAADPPSTPAIPLATASVRFAPAATSTVFLLSDALMCARTNRPRSGLPLGRSNENPGFGPNGLPRGPIVPRSNGETKRSPSPQLSIPSSTGPWDSTIHHETARLEEWDGGTRNDHMFR